MKQLSVLVMVAAVGVASACSDDDGGGVSSGGRGGGAGTGGGGGVAGTSGAAGTGGGAGSGNGGTGPAPVPPTPALPAGAPTLTCPTVINGALALSDGSQTGRHSRVAPVSACGATKAFPGNAADPSNPHLFDVYRFENPGTTAACFSFTLSYGAAVAIGDAGVDGGLDGGIVSPIPSVPDSDAGDASVGVPVGLPEPAKYLTAYGTFFPTDLSLEFLGDVGDSLTSPQAMGITVPAGETVDVVVYAVDNAPLGVGSYTLSCAEQ